MAQYVLFDTETTGKEKEDRIIQIGGMVVDAKGKVEVFDELSQAPLPIKLEAMVVHGITQELCENKSPFIQTKFYSKLQELNSHENYLIAHNISFDLAMLEKEGFVSKYKQIDTLRVAKHLIKDTNSYALQYLRYSLKLYQNEQTEAKKYNIVIKPHDAIGDVLVMKLLLSYLVPLVKQSYQGQNPMQVMATLTKTPIYIEKFKFGKYKGKTIEEVCDEDIQYINWLMEQENLDQDLKYTFDKIMGHI